MAEEKEEPKISPIQLLLDCITQLRGTAKSGDNSEQQSNLLYAALHAERAIKELLATLTKFHMLTGMFQAARLSGAKSADIGGQPFIDLADGFDLIESFVVAAGIEHAPAEPPKPKLPGIIVPEKF